MNFKNVYLIPNEINNNVELYCQKQPPTLSKSNGVSRNGRTLTTGKGYQLIKCKQYKPPAGVQQLTYRQPLPLPRNPATALNKLRHACLDLILGDQDPSQLD